MGVTSGLRALLAYANTSPRSAERLLLSTMFDKQLAFTRDPARRKVLIAGRRGGKTDLLCKLLLLSAELHPGEDHWSGYVTLTQGVSVRLIEGTINALIKRFALPLKWRTIKNQIYLCHDNGHKIWIGGIDDLRKANRTRGNKWHLFVIDEAGTFPPAILEYLTMDAVKMALTDVDGTLIVSGTPGPNEEGFFWEISTGLGTKFRAWPTYNWTVADNPHHPASKDPQKFFDSEREDLGWEKPNSDEETIQESRDAFDATNARFRRECLGVWAKDTEALIYNYDMDRNGFMRPPERAGQWKWILGIDCGHRDATTFTVSASCYGWPDVYVTESWGKPGLLPADVATAIHQIQQRHEIDRIVVDPAGGGAGLTANLVTTYGIHAYAADKRGKAAGIRLVQDGLRRGTLHVHPYHCAQLLSEWAVLGWNKKRDDHNPAQEDDCSDGCIYSVKEHHIVENFDPEPPLPGSREAMAVEASDYEERVRFEQTIRANSDLSPLQKRRMLRRR